jgi:CBS domain-containing protein
MYCGVLGKFVADFLYPPLYPQHMALEGIPTLTDSLHPAIAKLHAKDIMIPAETLPTIYVIDRLSNIMRVLQTSKRAIFPLVTSSGECAGLITRRSIMYAVPHLQSFGTAEEAEKFADKRINDKGSHSQELLDWHASTLTFNETLTADSMSALADHYVNLLPFADTGTIAARATTPTKRLAGLFRRLGCSHLCVVDRRNRFLGLVTRRGLIVPPTSPYNLPSSALNSGSRNALQPSVSSSALLSSLQSSSSSNLSRAINKS